MQQSAIENPVNYFFSHAAGAPGRPALVIAGEILTHGELAERAGRLAARLLREIDPADARVGILAKRSFEAYIGVFGVLMAGMAYAPIDPDSPIDRQLVVAQRSRLSALVTDRPLAPELAELLRQNQVKVFGPEEMADTSGCPLDAPLSVPDHKVAYLMFTSGTTGTPKAVMVTMGNVAHFLDIMRRRCPIYPDDRVSQFYELTFDVSVFDIFHGLGSGACLHVVPAATRMAPAQFIRDKALTVWSSVPSVVGFLQRLKQLKPGVFGSLRLSTFCGEPLLSSHVEAWRTAAPNSLIDNHYGPTEATVSCTAEWVGDSPRVTPNRGVIAIGKPYEEMHAGIVDADGAFLPPGKVGELAVSGPQVAAGYFDDPDLTRKRFRRLAHPVLNDAVFYLTGDLACQDEDGCFHHLGRIDHQVKILGRRVELEEIESHIRAVTGSDAVAIAWPVQNGGAVGVVAFIAGDDRVPGDVQAALKLRLPSYMVPRQIICRDSLPVSANGKLNRGALLRELEQMSYAHAE